MGAARIAALALAVPLVLAGCMGGSVNCDISTGDYECQFGGSGSIDRSDSWDNPNTKADVTVQMGGSGDITVTILDDDGTQVFRESYSGSGGQQESRDTSSGSPGDWTVEIEGQYAGGLQVQVQSI